MARTTDSRPTIKVVGGGEWAPYPIPPIVDVVFGPSGVELWCALASGAPRHFFDRQGRDGVQLLADLLSQQPPEELRRVVEVPLHKRVGASSSA